MEEALEPTESPSDLLYDLLMVHKLDYQTAWEVATREWAFLPTEDHPSSTMNPSHHAPETSASRVSRKGAISHLQDYKPH